MLCYAKSLQLCLTLCDPIDGSPPGSIVPGILWQEYWSGSPFPSPVHEKRKVKSLGRKPVHQQLPLCVSWTTGHGTFHQAAV